MGFTRWGRWPAFARRAGSGPAANPGVGALMLPGLVASGGATMPAITGSGALMLPGLVASGFGNNVPPPDIGTPLSAASIFYSGHSLCNRQIAEMVDHIATDRGYTNEFQTQMYPGSTIWARTANSGNPYVLAEWNGWTNGDARDGGSINALTEIQQTNDISATDYSHLIIAENHYSLNSLRWSEGLKALRAYYETFRAASPSGLVYYYDAWQWIKDPNDLTDWIAITRQQLEFWEGVASRINDSIIHAGRSDRLAVLPAGGALAELLELATTGTVDGITQGTDADTLFTVIQNEDYEEGDVHLTTVGDYFMGCVVYAAIYRRSPVGAATVSGVTSTQAASLQQVAWDYVSAYYTGNPLGPQHNTAARLAHASTFIATAADYYGDPGGEAGFQAFFSATDNGNPIYWSTSADAPAGGWWPFPT